MYSQNFRNQAVKEIKNGASHAATARKFSISTTTLKRWVEEYEQKMSEMTIKENTKTTVPVKPVVSGIKLQSVQVLINGAIVTLRRNDVLKMLQLFNIFDERIEGE